MSNYIAERLETMIWNIEQNQSITKEEIIRSLKSLLDFVKGKRQ